MRVESIEEWVRNSRLSLSRQIPDLERRMDRLNEWLADEAAEIRRRGNGVIPRVEWSSVARGEVGSATCAEIRRRGSVIVGGVFERGQATEWNERIGEYIEKNNYAERSASRAGLDQYFSSLASDRPQIFGLYWSRPQIEARQHENLDRVRRFLNRLWEVERADGGVEFDPDRQCNYADRLRRREPGDRSLGLSAHCDGGSIERWCDPGFQRVYQELFFGEVERYDPFRAEGRTSTREIPSPAVCSVFRTFQGWTALTAQGPGDGTLRLIPLAKGMAWLLMRALQSDVAADDLCGARAGRALAVDPRWHAPLLDGEVTIPRVEPGDTVWWHPDVIHAVEDQHRGSDYSNVIYIGAAPWCAKNEAFLARQAEAFLGGRSCPDFAPEDYEVDFSDRARLADLSPLGRAQMGFGL